MLPRAGLLISGDLTNQQRDLRVWKFERTGWRTREIAEQAASVASEDSVPLATGSTKGGRNSPYARASLRGLSSLIETHIQGDMASWGYQRRMVTEGLGSKFHHPVTPTMLLDLNT